jgi:hypothetical protein
MIMYGLQHEDGSMIGFSTEFQGEGQFNDTIGYELEKYTGTEALWLVKSIEVAESVATKDTAWYNSGSIHSPRNPFVGKLKVVYYDLELRMQNYIL